MLFSTSALPYELIGKATVAVLAITLGIGLLIATFIAALFVWTRGWKALSNLMWRGYDPEGDRPPVWKVQISGVALAMGRLEFRKIPAAYREASDLTDNDTTAKQTMTLYLKTVFVDSDNSTDTH